MARWNRRILLYLTIWAQVILIQVTVFVHVHFCQTFFLLILTGSIASKGIVWALQKLSKLYFKNLLFSVQTFFGAALSLIHLFLMNSCKCSAYNEVLSHAIYSGVPPNRKNKRLSTRSEQATQCWK